MRLIDVAIKDLEMIGDCRTCGNINPFCGSNPDSCRGYKWRGVPFTSSDDNQPLTPEQLRKMDGDPVWIGGNGLNCWDIFSGVSTDGIACFLRAALPMENCGEDWIPYRRKPKEGET